MQLVGYDSGKFNSLSLIYFIILDCHDALKKNINLNICICNAFRFL
jgi:hypothetical protein